MTEDAANPDVHPEDPAEGGREQQAEPGVPRARPAEPAEGSRDTEGSTAMTTMQSPAKDKNYNLLTVLQLSLQNVWQMETYIADAEREGDGELAEWLRKIQENNRKAGEQGKQMLQARLAGEGA
ncbi:hypothetical protein FHX42_002311 [Saccharopolyspora lacisalsi]|uniref:Uncharacterized protein n=2 Tax=Halosaccharopolyspora lacisalsi TaxID=1000566 RepID=A0A839DTZ6_9PSEU|nr:hypothetical protein [Halosaccharopolyspora lacisalsi]